MAKIISQQTYDETIAENITEFSMSIEEAREETIQQFEAQGINLLNIIKDLDLNDKTGKPILIECIEQLKDHVEGTKKLSSSELETCLDQLAAECGKSIPHRVHAGKCNTLAHIVSIIDEELNQETKNSKILHKSVVCGHAITFKNPDVFDEKTLKVLFKLLENQNDKALIINVLKWIQKACLLHEMNRQMIMKEDILMKHLKPLLAIDEPDIVKNVCSTFRYFILDDDIRCEFGKAHDHARLIGQEVLPDLTMQLKKFKQHEETLAEILLSIASLVVRNEFCSVVEEAGGLTSILDAMVEYPDSLKVHREAIKLLKALAGNDDVKEKIIKHGAAALVENVLSRYKSDPSMAKHCLACVSTLALRSKDNSQALFETGITESIVEAMKIHSKNEMIVRNGAWAIRNMVCRSQEQIETWLSHGVEDVLNNALQDHPRVDQDIRSALRDLGCKVLLKEEWKGNAEKVIVAD